MAICLRLGQYNPQHLGVRTLSDVLSVFRTYKLHVVSLTGRGQSQKRASVGGQLNVLQATTNGYWVLQWPHRGRKGAGSNKSCGCMIAVDRHFFPSSCLRGMWQPPDHIQGRAGAARFKIAGRFDICIITMYCPLSATDVDGQVQAGLLRWLRGLLDSLPARCTPIYMCDSNWHVGLEH
eukprot:6486231-Amphidinium_carterae.1